MKPARTGPLSSYLGTSITRLNSSQDQTQNFCKLQCHLHTQTCEQKKRSPAKSSRQKPRTRIPIQNASREFKSPAKGYERRWKKKKRNWITAREPTPCRATLAAARRRGGFWRRLGRAARDRCASGESGNGGGGQPRCPGQDGKRTRKGSKLRTSRSSGEDVFYYYRVIISFWACACLFMWRYQNLFRFFFFSL